MLRNKRFLILFALFVLSLVGISFYGGPVSYTFFWLCVSIPLILLLYIFLVIVSLRIYQKPEGRNMVCGSPSDFYITLQNEGFFSFSFLRIIFFSSFSTIMGLEDSVVYELPPHSSVTKKTQLVCRYRGQYEVGIKAVVVKDFLGVFSISWKLPETLNVIVAPAVVRISGSRAETFFSDADRENAMQKTEADIPVRDYIAGDELRFIQWKASAAMQKLMVRERTGEEKSGIALILDPKRCGESTEEYLAPENSMIECVLALALYYMEKNIPVDVFYYEGRAQKCVVQDAEGFERLYTKMLSYSFREDAGLLALLTEPGSLASYRMLMFVGQEWTAECETVIGRENLGVIPCRVFLAGGRQTDLDDRERRIAFVPIDTDRPLREQL
ncbi:MAG: DUF58 domain-containing protein [Lachnospiraceae bacterium]|nr:DUF58 domain-containing protein [Lachnospiraceae bacterium]